MFRALVSIFLFMSLSGTAHSDVQEERLHAYALLHMQDHIKGLTDAQALDCLVDVRRTVSVRKLTRPMDQWQAKKDDRLLEILDAGYSGYLSSRGVDLNNVPAATVAQTELFSLIDDLSNISWRQLPGYEEEGDVEKRCVTVTDAALVTMNNRLTEDYDAIVSPPSERKFAVNTDDDDVLNLFESLAQFKPDTARIEAQRCSLMLRSIGLHVSGDRLFEDDSSVFGYESYGQFHDDIALIDERVREQFEKEPNDPLTNQSVENEVRNELQLSFYYATPSQVELFKKAVIDRFPSCLEWAKE